VASAVGFRFLDLGHFFAFDPFAVAEVAVSEKS